MRSVNTVVIPELSEELIIQSIKTAHEETMQRETAERKTAMEFYYQDVIKFDTSFSDGQYRKTVGNNLLMNLYKDFKFTNIDDGIKNSVKWFY